MASRGQSVNPVKVTRNSLHEPTLQYASRSGEHDIVLIGNKTFERGDEFPMDDENGSGSGGSGPGEDGEDDFIVNVSRDEYFNVIFADCELPDLRDTHEKELPELMPKHAGFQKEGNPAQLSVVRSYKNALPRKRALTREAREELDELEAQYAKLMLDLAVEELRGRDLTEDGDVAAHSDACNAIQSCLHELELRIAELRLKISAVPYFEKLDLRYTKKEKVLVKSADAVFMMIMDISGSMDEEKKRMARKFFSLQYAFIKRKYPQTDLVFIAHTDKAYEMPEEEFFTTMKNGGTVVSPAYMLAHQIIRARYDANDTNIYLSQATDGDNWESDNGRIIPELEESGLLAKLRHMSYAQIGEQTPNWYGGTTLGNVIQSIANSTTKLSIVKILDDSGVFDAFHKIYRKPSTKKTK
jgi:hypothetical protein